ncbi:cupin domain-containing protein [Inquilinus sp. KBS0705]|nr:cupin domain-containing protein [Inquilinus sp. KBS0705]
MTDLKAYIDNGNLEQYCFELFQQSPGNEVEQLRSAHPEIKQELDQIELTIEQLAKGYEIAPNAGLKSKIFATLGFADDSIDINHLPPTNKYANYLSWLKAVEHLIPAQPYDDFFMEVLRHDENIAQMLVVTRLNVPEETHDVVAESFFILEGTCTCTVGNELFTLNAGDYLDIPLHTNHDIRIDSPYVVAILQHKFK